MSPPTPDRLRKTFESVRRKGSVKSSEIEALAKALGRVRHKRGSEPAWINPEHPHLRPVSIPHHSQDLNKFTARAILKQLEEDLEALESATARTEEE
jgi:predicted RNA binding protein YcfA (HicA-like mRNA interferase family)